MDGLKTFLFHRGTIRVAQIAIGVIMAWAGLAKIGNLDDFASQIHYFRMVPISLENLMAITLPWIEVSAALALILGIRAREGAVLSAVLLVVFTLAVGIAFARGLDIECGCFGTTDGAKVGAIKLLQNSGMILVSLVACLKPR
jgi:uncharacterized membrane protein YphA (DoxX/SURF4 family)